MSKQKWYKDKKYAAWRVYFTQPSGGMVKILAENEAEAIKKARKDITKLLHSGITIYAITPERIK